MYSISSEIPTSQAQLIISVINHSNPDLLIACIDSLFKSTSESLFDVWIVDNSMGRFGVKSIQYKFPTTNWIFNDQQQGFAANHNQVLTQSDRKYHCILNDDTIIHSGMFEQLIQFLDDHPNVGMVGPRILNLDGSIQASTFRFMSIWYQFIEHSLLPPPLVRLKQWSIDPDNGGNDPRRVDWLLGACIVIRAETLKQIGLLDHRLAPIGNMEDVDWCRRARAAGWDIWCVPTAQITHYGGSSYWKNSILTDRMRVEMSRANLRYHRKYGGWWAAAFVSLVYIITIPWNTFMLLQMFLRRRIRWAELRGSLNTRLSVANVGLNFLMKGDFGTPHTTSLPESNDS